MKPELTERVAEAKSASGDALRAFLHDPAEEVLVAALANPGLTESDVCILLERLDLSASILGAIAAHPSWKKNEGVRLRLARHPQMPRRVALQLLRQIFLFDLVQISLLPSAPAEIRRVAEEIILQRLPQLAVGEKLALARRGSARVAGGILAEGHPQASSFALNNPFLNEAQILRVLADPDAHERVVHAIAHHPRWSLDYNIRMALVRHPAAPLAAVLHFLPEITMRDLHELSAVSSLPKNLRVYIQKEVARRAATKT
ncbi:MAG: hypothetical protein ACYDCD_13610 [Candidatus Acidiferrales bacterium]